MSAPDGRSELRIGLLGCGRIGRIHAASIFASDGATLVAVADPAPQAAARLVSCGARLETASDLVRASDIDAVVIATSTDTHADLIEAAAAEGKAILCEKPVDLSAERIRRCVGVAERAGVPLMIGFNRRYDPHFMEFKRQLDAGEIGDVEILTILSRDPSPPPIAYIERSGGLFRDMMIHDFDMARFLLGEEPVEVFARGSCLVDLAIGATGDIDTAVVVMKTGTGKLVNISNSRRAAHGFDQRIEAHGAKGMLRAGNIRHTSVEASTAKGSLKDPSIGFFAERYAASYHREFNAFVEAVRTEQAPQPNGYDGLAAQLLADAATESAKSRLAQAVTMA
jgi:myo-inositol 2-dehydrogenase/D-chiro-inositol 1-dehydrogenase